jgi:hypothetical protein
MTNVRGRAGAIRDDEAIPQVEGTWAVCCCFCCISLLQPLEDFEFSRNSGILNLFNQVFFEFENNDTDLESCSPIRPVTGPYRRHMTFGRGVCRIQTGTAEFKSLYRSGSTVLPNLILTYPEESSRAPCQNGCAERRAVAKVVATVKTRMP